MKGIQKKGKDNKAKREQIMVSALASFRIEGIDISKEKALIALKKGQCGKKQLVKSVVR